MTDNPEKNLPRSYECGWLPAERMGDLELLKLYRDRFGNEVVNEQIAIMGTDRVIDSMQRAHRAHQNALALDEKELHQRAEMVESLMIEFGIPAKGSTEETQTDLGRMELFIQVVKGLADTVAEQQMRDEATQFVSYDDVEDEASSS